MRSVLAVAALLLAACGAESPGEMANGAAAPPPGEPDNRIQCMVQGAERFERVCSIDSADGADGHVLILRKPDGGFRRLLVTGDSRRYIAADGAEQAHITQLRNGVTEVSIGGDHFRLPLGVAGR